MRWDDDPFSMFTALSEPQFITCGLGLARDQERSWLDADDDGGGGEAAESSSSSPGGSTAATKEVDARLRALRLDLGDDHPDVATATDAAARACSRNGDRDDALRLHAEALSLKRGAMGQRHPSVADTLCAMGAALSDGVSLNESLGVYAEAIEIYESALAEGEGVDEGGGKCGRSGSEGSGVGRNSPAVEAALRHSLVGARNAAGSIKFDQQRYDAAMEDYGEALRQARGAVRLLEGAADSAVAEAQQASELLRDGGGVPCAEEKQWRRMAQAARTHVADSLSNVASVHAERKRWAHAISRYNEALGIQMDEHGEADLSVSNTLMNIGTMQFRFGNYPLALKAYKQAWKMRNNLLGRKRIEVSDALVSIAMVHERTGDARRAEINYSAAHRVACRAVGLNNIKVAGIKSSLAGLYSRTSRDDLAVKTYTDVWKLYKLHGLDDDHHLVKSAAKNIAEIKFRNQDDMAAAVVAFYEVLTFFSHMSPSAFNIDDPVVDGFLGKVGKANAHFSMAVC